MDPANVQQSELWKAPYPLPGTTKEMRSPWECCRAAQLSPEMSRGDGHEEVLSRKPVAKTYGARNYAET